MRIAFFGTPEFATAPLRALIGEGHEVVLVVTQPDRPRGRSRSQLDPSPVKLVALEENIPVLQPERPRGDAAFLEALRAAAPDISVVVAYGHILPRDVIDLPTHGTLNIHASLLPAYRGAAPIQAAVRDGCAETGVTIMRMVSALDAGPAILTIATPIAPDETAGELQLRLSELTRVDWRRCGNRDSAGRRARHLREKDRTHRRATRLFTACRDCRACHSRL